MCLSAFGLSEPRLADSQSSGIALPIVTTAPPVGYEYSVIQTVDQNTGGIIWIVYMKKTFWAEYWMKVLAGVTTATITGLGFLFRGTIASWLPKFGKQE